MNGFREFSATPEAARACARVAIGLITRTKHEHNALGARREPLGAEVLITRRRSGTVFAGWWEFPGGKAEAGESLVDCLHRELREEIGVRIDIAGSFAPVEHDYDHALVRLHPFLCSLARGSHEPRNIEVAEHRWVAASELRASEFPPGNASIIARLRERFAIAADLGSEPTAG